MRKSVIVRPRKYKNISLKKMKKGSSHLVALLEKLKQLHQENQFYQKQLKVFQTFNIQGLRELITEHENLNKTQADALLDAKLHRKTNRELIAEEKIKQIHNLIIKTASTIMQANYVTFHTYIPDKQSLKLSSFLGFEESAANLLKCVTFDDSNSYALAMNDTKSIFVLNIEDSHFLLTPNLLCAYRLAGICSVLLSPLFSSSKELLGVLSIHWKTENEPSERELSLLNLLLGQSAALMGQFYERIAMMEDNLWLISQKEAFHSAMRRKPLEHSLRTLIDTVANKREWHGSFLFDTYT